MNDINVVAPAVGNMIKLGAIGCCLGMGLLTSRCVDACALPVCSQLRCRAETSAFEASANCEPWRCARQGRSRRPKVAAACSSAH